MAGLEIPSIIVQDNGAEHGYSALSPPSPRFRRKRPSRDNIDNLMQESLSADDWSTMDMDDENFYDECDSTAGLGDATCDSGHVAGSTGSSNSSPEQQQRLNNLSRFGGSGSGVGAGTGSGGYRQKNSSKMKLLVRSHALREAASPPPDSPTPCSLSPTTEPQAPLTPREGADTNPDATGQEAPKISTRPRTRQAGGSSQCSVDSSTSFVSFSLSRDSSAELGSGTGGNHTYTDNTGVDLHHFIIETLHRNYKDRTTLLRIEQEMVTLVRDSKRTCHRFPAMSSYHRMLVHRVAAYFGLEHNVDQSGNCVVVSKSVHTRLPDVPFKQYVRDDLILPEEPNKKSNLRREAVSFDELHASGRYRSPETRSRSFEERQGGDCGRAARNRTFHPQSSWNSSQDKDGSESAYTTSSSHHASHDDIRYSQPRKYAPHGILRTNRIPKVESFDGRDLLCNYGNSLRPAVAKSYSFGGYTAPPTGDGTLVRGESAPTGSAVAQHHSPKLLSKQDSNSSSVSISRSSPTSSGYKSQQSVSAAPSPSPIMNRASSSRHPQTSSNGSVESQSTAPPEWVNPPKQQAEVDNTSTTSLLWAVTSLDAVPSGSILINPHSGQPFYNSDGSMYRYDPNQPLPFQLENTSGVMCQPNVVSDEMNVSQGQAGPEMLQSYESYDENATGKVEVYAESNASALSSVPIYQTWPPSYYDGTSVTPTASPGPYGQTVQPYYSEFNPSLNSPNGYYVAHPAAAADDQMKTLTAVPLPHGQGYVVYQACVAPPPDVISTNHVENELNPLLKNLSLRPLLPVPYSSVLPAIDGIPQPADVNAMHSVYTVPVANVRATNPQLAKIQVSTGVSGAAGTLCSGVPGARPTFSSAPTPVPSATNVSGSLMAPNSYMTSIRVHNSGHVIAPSGYPAASLAASPYTPVVYPLSNQAPSAQPNGQHYISTSVVHHYNNAQYVSQPRPLLLSSPTPSRCRTPDREGTSTGDVAVTRMIHGSLPSNRFPFVYGSSLGSPVLSGEIRALRPSPAFFHRQYSLPTPPSQGLYALRPRLQPQLTLAGPQVANPNAAPILHQGNMALASRPPRMRRQSSSRNNSSSGITSTSATPTQSCSSSPIQHLTNSS